MRKFILIFFVFICSGLVAHAEGINPPVAIKTDEGVFLSWPMDKSEEYTIYRDGEAIATTKITNYTDFGADGSGEYRIGDKAVAVWNGQYLEVPLSVPEPYAKVEQELRHVIVKPVEGVEMNIGSDWTVIKGVDVNWSLFEDNDYSFFAAPDGSVIDVFNAKTAPGTAVGTYSHNNGDWQKFRFEEASGGYYMRDKHSGLYLSVNPEGAVTIEEISKATVFSVADVPEAPTDEVTALADRIAELPAYGPGDASIGDLDGDGEWEIVLKWDPSNCKDSAHDGFTGRVFIDGYELDGTLMWRIDLGKNIRAGAHDTQFVTYDFDGDGKAEVAFRISDGAVDGRGNVIGDGDKDWRNGAGKNLTGPLWLAVFDGQTGALLDKTDFDPQNEGINETIKTFGDDYGNRSERYNACVAYLDGVKPYMVFQRGYYARTVVAAYSFENGKIEKYWRFDTMDEGNGMYGSNGNHNISVGDGDGDGCDEIYLGSLTLDHDGSVLWCGFEGHGDAMHLGDFDPDNEGLEFFSVHESGQFGYTIHDAGTGEKLFDIPGAKDTGRGMIANVGPFNGNYIVNVGSGARRINSWGETPEVGDYGNNFRIYWDGDLYDELMSGTNVVGYSADGGMINYFDAWPDGFSSINGTKATPCLSADMFGDWREEIMCKKIDGTALRIYTTTIPSDFALPPLMEDHVYRMGIVWQNSSYNQPPHLGYYLSGYAQMKIGSVNARINGQDYSLYFPPYIFDKLVYVPLDFLCEVSGARMFKDEKTTTITLCDTTVVLTVGTNKCSVNGTETVMSGAACEVKEQVMIPLCDACSFLDLTGEYDDDTQTVTVKRNALDFLKSENENLREEIPDEKHYSVAVENGEFIIDTTKPVTVFMKECDEQGILKKALIYKHMGKLEYTVPDRESVEVYVWDEMEPVVPHSESGELIRKLPIEGFTASAEPEANNAAENSCDGKRSTVWAAQGVQNIVYDLGKVCTLRNIDVAFFKYDDERYIPFEVYVSEDNAAWSLVHEGNSPIKSDEFVSIDARIDGRYIKVVVKGNTVNGWSRISEVEIHGTYK